MSESGELIIYQAEDGHTRVTCRVAEGTLWLNQAEIASLFETTTQNITTHISSIYEESEQPEQATCKDYLQIRQVRRIKYLLREVDERSTTGREPLLFVENPSFRQFVTQVVQRAAGGA